jgi:hypothetical protein
MGTAIDLFGAVYTTDGGTRYHADPACYALANGRAYHAWRAGRTDGMERGTGLYDVRRRSTISAVQFSYTACLVCVRAADALPPLPFVTGESYGHKPWFACLPDWRKGYGCARCRVRVRVPNMSRYDDPDDVIGWHHETHAVPWPCTSAVVLGLVAVDADRWNARYPVGTPVAAYPGARWDEPLRTTTRTPAWRLHGGDSLVSVDGYAGGIALTHVDPL